MFAVRVKSFAAVLLVVLLFGFSASAQKSAPKPNNLSSESNEVLKTLASLSSLPNVQWRFHEGDLAHGESATLDDSQWKKVKSGFTTEGNEAAWFRTTVEVPQNSHGYDLSGATVWFRFRARAGGPAPLIIYFNGRRVALGEDMEPIILFSQAKPGDKVVIAVKVLQTDTKKTFQEGSFRVETPEGRPNPGTLREEMLATATLLPVLPDYKPQTLDTINSIISSVDLNALKKSDQKAFDVSLKSAREQLMKFRPELQKITVNMVGNSHIDAAWLWPESETIDVVRRTWGTALQLMNEYPGYKFTQSAAVYNEWMAKKYPELNHGIQQRIKEGRWEIVGGMWVEPDLNMPDGESLVRQILLGKRFYKKEYGVDVRIGWNPDSFGYTWQLPQIYKKTGIDYFVTQKMHWSDTNQLPLRLFWWESPDGSKVLTYFPTDYVHTEVHPSREARDIAQTEERNPGTTETMDLYGVGDHGGGPTRVILDEAELWSKPGMIAPKMQFSTAQEFFSKVEKTIIPESPVWNYDAIGNKTFKAPEAIAGKLEVPTWKDELYLEYHRGVFTTQAMHKRYMRESEESLLNAEKYASLAWLRGVHYPGAAFEDSWKKVTFNQFHDLAAGSGIGIIYEDAAENYKHIFQQTRDADHASLPALVAPVDTRTGGGVPIVLFNPLAWTRSGIVAVDVQMADAAPKGIHIVDAKGTTLLTQVLSSDSKTNTFHLLVKTDAPSLGYTVLHALPGASPVPTDLVAKDLTLENALLKVVIDGKTGCITSLVEKKSNFETIAAGGCGNQLQTFVDTPKQYDAWNIDPGTLDHFTPITEASSVKLIDNGPLRASIQIERTWQKSHFLQTVVLEAGSDHVTFENKADWQEEHVLLKAAFPLAATSAKATFEIPYGTIDRSTLRVNSWEKAMFEVPAMRWADLGDGQHGVTLMNQAKYGYDSVGNWLRLTLLRSPTSPDPVADRGEQNFTYAVYPHSGTWQQAMSMHHGYDFNYPMRAMQVSAHGGSDPFTRSYVSTDQDNVVITAVKKAEDHDALVFRFFEWAGKSGDVKLHIPAGATSATLSDLMENAEATPLKLEGNAVTVPVHPFEIVTVQVAYKPM